MVSIPSRRHYRLSGERSAATVIIIVSAEGCITVVLKSIHQIIVVPNNNNNNIIDQSVGARNTFRLDCLHTDIKI